MNSGAVGQLCIISNEELSDWTWSDHRVELKVMNIHIFLQEAFDSAAIVTFHFSKVKVPKPWNFM